MLLVPIEFKYHERQSDLIFKFINIQLLYGRQRQCFLPEHQQKQHQQLARGRVRRFFFTVFSGHKRKQHQELARGCVLQSVSTVLYLHGLATSMLLFGFTRLYQLELAYAELCVLPRRHTKYNIAIKGPIKGLSTKYNIAIKGLSSK